MRNSSRTLRVGAWVLLLAVATGASPLWGEEQPPSGASTAPRILVEQGIIDFGEVLRGKEVEGSFVVRNTGGETLRILDAKPG